MMRRSRGYVPASVALPRATAPPLLACGAELKNTVLPGQGRGAPGSAHHIGDLENWETLRSFREGIEHFERAVRGRAGGGGARPAPRVPVDQVRAGARGRGARRRAAPPRPPRRLPGRARRDRARRSGAIYDGTGYGDRRHGVGRGAAGGRPAPASSAPASCGRCGCRAASAAMQEPWRMACAWLGAAGAAAAARRRRRSAGRRWRRCARAGTASPLTTERWAAVRRGRRAVRVRADGHLRGAGGGGARGARDPRGAPRAPTRCPSSTAGRSIARRASQDLDGGVEVGRWRPASTTASPRARAAVACVAAARGLDTAVLSGGVFQNRLLLERDRRAARGRGPARAASRSACRPTTAGSPTARPRWRPRCSPLSPRMRTQCRTAALEKRSVRRARGPPRAPLGARAGGSGSCRPSWVVLVLVLDVVVLVRGVGVAVGRCRRRARARGLCALGVGSCSSIRSEISPSGDARVPQPEHQPEGPEGRDQHRAVDRLDHRPGEDPGEGGGAQRHRDDRHRGEHRQRRRRLAARAARRSAGPRPRRCRPGRAACRSRTPGGACERARWGARPRPSGGGGGAWPSSWRCADAPVVAADPLHRPPAAPAP